MMQRGLDPTTELHRSRSVTDLLQDTATHTENVVRGEIRLAVVKVQEQVAAKAKRAALLVGGSLLGFVAFVVLVVAGIQRLAEEMAPWLATALGGLFVLVFALVVLFAASRTGADS
jgi:uncharacterized membrane protein YqjE